MLPDSSVLGLSKEERKKITVLSKDNQTYEDALEDISQGGILYSFEVADIKNGFLKLAGAMEGSLQLCYWKLDNGDKMIAVYQEGCGPECYVERFDFYTYDGKTFSILPYEKVIPDIYHDFFKKDIAAALSDMEMLAISASLLFELPREGKNILAKWGNSEEKVTYEEFARGDRMVLIWNNGRFEKGKLYWSR